MSSLSDLQQTVEAIREERYPTLPADVVRKILELEDQHVEDRGPAPRLVEAVIDAWLDSAD
jgi:Fe-S-cluster formation regulator IscX/YfhJ